jgi:hypothetical protein
MHLRTYEIDEFENMELSMDDGGDNFLMTSFLPLPFPLHSMQRIIPPCRLLPYKWFSVATCSFQLVMLPIGPSKATAKRLPCLLTTSAKIALQFGMTTRVGHKVLIWRYYITLVVRSFQKWHVTIARIR